jgi:Zn-dependent M28 family amino/carboxypeptidase
MLIPNSNNYDDNTSGVIALLLLAKKCKAHGINNVKFIFVDNEEIGLLGSYAHRKYLEQAQLISTRCKIISLDCVGVGKFPLISRNGPPNFAEPFFKTFQNHYDTSKLIYSIIPLSDDYSFSGYGAINISFVNKAIFPSGYTISNIHSFKDKKIDLHKIEKLTDVLTEIINAEKNV